MANTEKQDAMVFPIHVCGTLSPYPIVVTVTFEKNMRTKIMPANLFFKNTVNPGHALHSEEMFVFWMQIHQM